jgi:hypothetical protein
MSRADIANWQARYEDLARAWAVIQDVHAHDLAGWEDRIDAMSSQEATLRDAGQWTHGRDDLLGVIWQHRDELTHSRMIGWLLDPCARHGLGSRVLRLLLRETFPGDWVNDTPLNQARVQLEVPVAEGRMDIVVSAPGLYLVIENKVDAPEGEKQVRYYIDHVRVPDARFILLSPDGWPAEDAPECKPFTYSQVASLLGAALVASNSSASGRAAAIEYLRTLRKEFKWPSTMHV